MGSYEGAAVVHDNTAYFSHFKDIYSYAIPEDKWSKLKPCRFGDFSMAVVKDKLTTIGGQHGKTAINTLCCLSSLSRMKWEELLPPMPTKRVNAAAVTTSTHLVVAGGISVSGVGISTVEVLNFQTLQWALASSLPEMIGCPTMTLCDEHVYLSGDESIFSCSVEELVKSCNPANSSAGDSVWTRLPDTPTYDTTLATLKGRVLTIGGTKKKHPTGAIHCYDSSTNSWSVIGEMPTPRYGTLVAVLPSSEVVVVGGYDRSLSPCNSTEIAHP